MLSPESDEPEIIRRQSNVKVPRVLGHWLIGRPIMTADTPRQSIGKAVGLAIFASDVLSSTAYATQETLGVLSAGGSIAYSYVFPLSIAIVVLLAILTISYRETIQAYHGGGGAYVVVRDNLGELFAQMASAALLTAYLVLVAVSVSAGVAQIVSGYPSLHPYRVEIAVVAVVLIMLSHLRGVGESGVMLAIPTYFFVSVMTATVAIGLFRYFTGSLGKVIDPPELHLANTVTAFIPFLLLHAFANGTFALTGLEAISNSVTAFKHPSSRNAGITLIWMSIIIGSLFLGISYLTSQIGAVYSPEETVISQLARTVFNRRGWFYLTTLVATTIILLMAANTAFADFPRLGARAAADGFLPRQLTLRGSRLAYSNGVVVLGVGAIFLIIFFQASVTRLFPLYAVGVFLGLTLSQAGMARHWWKVSRIKVGQEVVEPGSVLRYENGWRFKMLISGFGAVCTAIVMVIFIVTRFREGAWVVLVLIPALIRIFYIIHNHYKDFDAHLALHKVNRSSSQHTRHRVVLPVSSVHQGTLKALHYAKLLSNDVTAIHISTDPSETEHLQNKWRLWGEGTRLLILDSPFRLFVEPLVGYIEEIIDQREPNELITVVIPEFIPTERWQSTLHLRTAELLRKELLSVDGVIVIDVPYYVRHEETE